MLKRVLSAFMGTRHERDRKKIQPILDAIHEHEARLASASDDEVRGQTAKFRKLLHERTDALETRVAGLRESKRAAADAAERDRLDTELSGLDGSSGLEAEIRRTIADTLDEILPEAFATMREASRRLLGTLVSVTGRDLEWNMVPYDVQLMGGIQLHFGKIAEMATGEGKTLVATLPLYLNALPGKGTHLVTVNPYLARRDSQWMGHLYSWLGLTVGCLDDTEAGTPERRAAYMADITYGTNNEFGFDYLRDNMVTSLEQRVQRSHVFALVDEVDSVLIDEARTPLIISGPVGNEGDVQYFEHNTAISRLVRKQMELVNVLVADAEREIEAGRKQDAAVKMYQAQLGHPKNRKLVKMLNEQGNKQLVLTVELDHLADRKLPPAKQVYRDVEEDLLFVLDERGHSVHLTDRGVDYMAPNDHDAYILPDLSEAVHRIDHATDMTPEQKIAERRELEIDYAGKSERLNIVHQLLRAHALYEKDVNYVVQDGEVLIVDENTGRTMPGRRWSEGLHQAVEAKEGVRVKGETQTMATITIQNYFRMYEKLAGMTGTAETEETEFFEIYKLEVAVIPTNRDVIRDDRHDLVYKTRREKYNAIVEETRRLHELGYPVLIGTTSVDASETLSKLIQRAGMVHNVLNAKYHQREAEIVQNAGQPGAITIATNMAGRGTDIKLGEGVTPSKPSVIKDPDGKDIDVDEMGGLHIVGSERHESRRIDRQLRGRAGRQGDPGASQFFLSLEDDLMRLFGSDRIAKLMDRMGAQEGEVLTHPLITRSIEQAQKRVELQNFQSRKKLLEYDDVMNQQREVIYSLRAFALEGGEELKGEAVKMVEKAVSRRVETVLAEFEDASQWDFDLLRQELLMHYLLQVKEFDEEALRPSLLTDAQERVSEAGSTAFAAKIEALDMVRDQEGGYGDRLLRYVMFNVLDEKWKDHLYDLDQLRNAIHYRSWGQKDPLVEYKQEAYTMFVDLMNDVAETFTDRFLKVQLVIEEGPPPELEAPPAPPSAPVKRYNAMGVVEEYQPEGITTGTAVVADVGPAETPNEKAAVVRRDPVIVGAGRARSASELKAAPSVPVDWTSVGRNDPCPCGSGKKFKKCHGTSM
ncbi:preprotein translocase subunit SecA [soil metagenome]